jgi:hypothetical protein
MPSNMPTIRVNLPRVHLAGSDAHSDAHIEVGQHGFAVFLSPDAEHPLLDIDGTRTQLDDLVEALKVALASQAVGTATKCISSSSGEPASIH